MTDSTAIPYSMGFSVTEQPLEVGDHMNVAFLTTMARITRNGEDSYQLETAAPLDIKRPGAKASSGVYTDLAISRVYGKTYSEATQEIDAWKQRLTADELDQCLSQIGRMTVNSPQFHSECAERDANMLLEQEVPVQPAAVISSPQKRGMIDTMRALIGRSGGN